MFSRAVAASNSRVRTALALVSILALALSSVTLFASLTLAVQNGDPWMFFAHEGFGQTRDSNAVVEEPQMDISGNENIYDGPMHSNRNTSVSGNQNDFNEDVRYFDDFEDTAPDPPDPGANFYEDLAQAAATLDWPGTTGPDFTEPTCQFGTRSTAGNKAMTAADPDGVYCLDNGNFDIAVNGLGTQAAPRQWTFITDGLINESGEGNWIVPAPNGDGVLAYTTADSPQAIEWHGNLGGAEGLMHAPNGHVDVEGNENVYCLQIVAQRVEVGGNENVWGWPCAATAPPPPTPTPTEGQQGGNPTPSPTPTEGTAGGNPTPTEGGGQLGGNPAPTRTPVPNTAFTPDAAVQLPAAILALLALGSLGFLIRAQKAEARARGR